MYHPTLLLVVASVIVSLACYDFFSYYAPDDTKIKWPNDIYWKDRKAGGILIENFLRGDTWNFSVIGIGININQTLFSPHIPNPVSLKQITGKTFNVIDLAKELCTYLEARWQQLKVKSGDTLIAEYFSIMYKAGETITLNKN